MNVDPTIESKIEEIQVLERNLQNILIQKQNFQVELNETDNALQEVKKSKEDVYKIVGGIMIRASVAATIKELEEKRKVLDLRVNSLEKQEKVMEEKGRKLRDEVSLALNKDKKDKN